MTLRKRGGDRSGPDWIAIYITHNLPEAHVIVGKLQSYGIPAMIHQEAGASAIGITLGNLGEIKILVSPADYDRAAELLKPEEAKRVEASNDKIQLIWPDSNTVDTDNEE